MGTLYRQESIQQQDDVSTLECGNRQVTIMVSTLKFCTVVMELTRRADRFPVTSVDGLSCTKVSLRFGGSCSDHSVNSFSKAVMVFNERSLDVFAGYRLCKTFERIREAQKRARALDIFEDSPGNVGRYPRSSTYSSSMGSGYSVSISESCNNWGRPIDAAEKL